MTHQPPWGEIELAQGAADTRHVGTLHLGLRRESGEVWVRFAREGGAALDDAEWQRWAVPDDTRLRLRPAVPDRLLVVSHENPFHLPGRRRARIYVRVPLFVQLVLDGPELGELRIVDQPSLVLSDTWWGTVQEGELAYWLTTKARASVTDDLFLPHVAMCPVHLENASEEALPVDRFSVRALHLSLFRKDERLWTDEVHVRYAAALEGSEIEFGGRPPREAPGAELLAEPRVAVRRGFQARTFDRLLSLAALGG